MLLVALAVFVDLDDVGMHQPEARLGFLVEPRNGSGVSHEPLTKNLDGDRLVAFEFSSPVDPGEGSFGNMKENLAAAVKEAGRVPFLESLDLPGGQDIAPE